MDNTHSKRFEVSPIVRDILLILVGTFIASGFQAFQTLVNLYAYPQLFPTTLNFIYYGETQFLLFIFSFGLAFYLVRRMASMVVVQGNPTKVNGETSPPPS